MSRFVLVAALALPFAATVTAALPAAAAPTAADMETARTLFTEGKALREKGDLPAALERFRAAHALGRTPITAVELGRTLVQMGRLTEGREVLLEVTHIAADPNESPARLAARRDALELVDSLRTRIPSLVITFTDLPSGAPAPSVVIDGAPVPPAAITLPRKVDPGPHEVIATFARGRQRTVKVDAKEGATVPVVFTVGADAQPLAPPVAAVVAPPPKVGADAAPPPAPAAHGSVPALTWVGLSVAGAGVVAGAITGGVVLSKASTIKNDDAAAGGCKDTPHTCTSVSSAKTLSTVSDVSFALAGAGAILAAVTFFTRDRSTPASAKVAPAPHVEPWIGVGAAGLKGAF